jgi:hypothetical protein
LSISHNLSAADAQGKTAGQLIKNRNACPILIPFDVANALVLLGYGSIWSGAPRVSPLFTCKFSILQFSRFFTQTRTSLRRFGKA